MAEKKIVNFLIVLCASCLFIAPGVANVAGISSPPPQNREPAEAPALTDGWEYVRQLGAFVNDRLALRDRSLKVDSFIDRNIFKEQPAFGGSATPQVLEGEDGYLFLKDAFDAACNGHGTPQSIAENVKRFAEIVQRSGREVVISIAPDKSSVLVDKLPEKNLQADCHRKHQEQFWKSLGDAKIPGYVDLRTALKREVEKNRRPLYFRQDSHWNQEGSLVGVKQVVERFQSNLWDESAVVFTGVTPYTGDLEAMRGGTKIDETSNFGVMRSQVEVVTPQNETQPVGYRQVSQMSGSIGRLVEGETLMMYDSFGMAAIEQVVPYFQTLKTVHFEDFNSDKWIEMIRSADNILFMCVERAMGYRLTYDMGNSKFLDALDIALNGSK
jgi:hypothetical protein